MFQGDKMRKFDYDDNDDFREDIDKFFNNEDFEKYDEMIEEEFELQKAQIDIAHRDINGRIMRTAVRICEKTFLWSFYSLPTRLRMIAESYKKLRKIED